jgi:glycosyltransferase involved in cell wall biosynthesis
MQWFCRTVWPLITRQLPHLSLRIAGVGTEVASGWAPHVEGLGHVVDAGAEMATWAVMIVPIRRGAGTRIKVLEGFARRCPVVATSLGAFGYDLRDGEELFIADAPEVFASRCVDLIRTPLLAHALTDRAHRRFLKCWTWDAHADIVRRAVHDVSASTAHTTHP